MKSIIISSSQELHGSLATSYSSPNSTASQTRHGKFATSGENRITTAHSVIDETAAMLPRLTNLEPSHHAFFPRPTPTPQLHYPHSNTSMTSPYDDVRATEYKYYQTSYGAYSGYLSPTHARTSPYPLAKPPYAATSPANTQIYSEYADTIQRFALFEGR